MNISDPVANYNERVMVHNYRSKPKDGSKVYEDGIITSLSYKNGFGKFSWNYTVRLTRQTSRGNYIFLHVGDDQIEKFN